MVLIWYNSKLSPFTVSSSRDRLPLKKTKSHGKHIQKGDFQYHMGELVHGQEEHSVWIPERSMFCPTGS